MTRIATLFALVVTLSPATTFADPDPEVSLPWQLRPVITGDVVRLDSAAAAFNDRNGNLDLAVTTMFTGSYRLSNGWAPMLRLGLVGNDAPGAALDDRAFANPLIGATYVRTMGSYRLAFFGGATLPIGTGGARTSTASMTARPADRVMFDNDSMAGLAGVDVAYVHRHFTAQGEVTLMPSVRVRGNDTDGDPLSTRASVGLHLGYLVGSHVTLGGDLHYDDTLTASVGVRGQFRIGNQAWIRPGIAFVRGLDERGFDAPLITAQTSALEVSVQMTL